MNVTGTTAAATSSSTGAPAVSPRLHQAATQFEAMLLKDLLKPLGEKDSMSSDDDGGETGPLQGFAVESIAGSMARSGALGFAKQIEQTLAHGAQKKFSQEALKS